MRTFANKLAQSRPPEGGTTSGGWLLKLFAAAFGVVLGVALLKFPNPPVLEHLVTPPSGAWEWLLSPWPVRYGHVLLAVLAVAGVALARRPRCGCGWPVFLPLAWLGWIGISLTQTMDAKAGGLVPVHFAACVGCFYLGLLVLGRLNRLGFFLAGLLAAFAVVLVTGWQQRFGGLETSRLYFFTYVYPTLPEVPPEMLKRVQSDRIFSTLFYPNSLAGALLLLTPLVLGVIADARGRLTVGARWLLMGILGAGAGGCLVWSGSKAGWLLAMGMAGAVLLRIPVGRRAKVAVISVVLIAGVGGFAARYVGFFQKGATSVVARFDYWQAAWQNVVAHPVTGSGPGTFATVYGRLKAPDAEMTRLVHNDYLQQASDSGLAAGILLLGTVGWVLIRTRDVWRDGAWGKLGLWLGLAAFALQSIVEFGFYVPATAWCWFALAGWLAAQPGLGFDNQRPCP
jgi:O-antigen ligase